MSSTLITLFGVQPELAESLREISPAFRFDSFSDAQAAPAFLRFLGENHERVLAIVLGAEVRDPVQMVQRIRSLDDKVSVLVLGKEGSFESLKRALQFAPFIGDQISCVAERAGADLRGEVIQAVERTRRKRTYLKLVASAQRRLASTSAGAERRSDQSYFDNLPDYVPIGITALDREGLIVAWNRKAVEVLGWQEREVLGVAFSSLFAREDRAALEKASRDAGAGRAVKDQTLRVARDSSSGERFVHLIFGPLSGHFARQGSMVVFQDITERKRTEQELERSRIAAEAANLAKTSFLANMSHEIRTPLGAVLGFAELLAQGDSSASERLNAIEAVRRNSAQVLGIINEVLDLSRIEAGRLDLEKQRIQVSELVAETLSILGLRAEAGGLTLQILVEGAIPRCIDTDALRLKQVLINVVGNAIKFSPAGTIDIRVRSLGERLLGFDVKDSGPGLSEEQAKKLFQPFSQVDGSLTRRHGGTGLGLVLARRFARALGGDVILLESYPGRGSTFRISVDTGAVDASDTITSLDRISEAPPSRAARLEKPLSALRVLLVEDSIDNQLLITRHLKASGADVDVASNGEEGVEKAIGGEFSVVLMDLQMPVLDGFGALLELRAKSYDRPVIALTAHALQEDRDRCLAAGFREHVTKPVTRAALVDAIRGVLDA